jgi:hypothetical protein
VEGRLTYREDGDTWLEYVLQDGERLRWLSVEEDDHVQVMWLEPTTAVEVTGTPPRSITVADIPYRQVEAGTAEMTRAGALLNQHQRCQYFDYAGPENRVLCIEDWDGEIEVTVGQRISPRALVLLPGDGQRVYGD